MGPNNDAMSGEKIEFGHSEIGNSRQNDDGLEALDYHIRDDHGDPHRAALEDINEEDAVISKSTWAAVFFLGFTFQPSLSFTILCVFPILVPIALELQGTTDNVNWMASGWSLAGSVSFAIAGQLSDYFGRRYILLFGQALLILGHITGATSQSVNQGIAAMVLLGFGTGTTFVLYPGITELLPNKHRPIGLAWTELNLLPFSTFGPLIARSLLTHLSWRWVYYLGLITGVISFVGTAIFYNPPSKPLREKTRLQIMSELDYLGIFLYTAGLTLFLLGLGWGGVSHPWKSAAVIAPLILGAVIFALTFVWDFSGRPKRPLFPKRLFIQFREYTFLLVIIFVTGTVYFTLTDLLPAQIGYMFTSDSTKAGLYNIPAGFGGAAGGVILGGLIPRIKHVHWQLVVGIALQTLFTALFALITPNTIPMALVFQLLANIPFAWITLCCYVTAGLHVPQRDLGLALGLIGTFRFLGGAIGTTVFSTILNNKAATSIPARVIAAIEPLGYPVADVPALIAALTAGTTSMLSHTSTQVIAAASSAMQFGYGDAFRLTWLISIPFGVIACGLAAFVRDPSPYFTAHTAVILEKERIKDARHSEKRVIEHVDESTASA
jgi:MFS family permease